MTTEAARVVEGAVKDQYDHSLAGNPVQANRAEFASEEMLDV